MKCNECGYEFNVVETVWDECPGGGTVAVCPNCKSSYISDKEDR